MRPIQSLIKVFHSLLMPNRAAAGLVACTVFLVPGAASAHPQDALSRTPVSFGALVCEEHAAGLGTIHLLGFGAALLLAAAAIFAFANLRLRQLVEDRTQELTAKNELLEKQAEELRAVEASLRTKQEYLYKVVNSDLVGVSGWDSSGGLVEPNNYYLELLGYTREEFEAKGVNWRDVTPPEYTHLDDKALAELAETGRCTPFEKEFVRKDGSRIPVIIGAATFGSPHRGVACILDISAQRRAEERLRESEEQLRQSQKMESMGRLAGGVAHDFNNLLTVINGYSTMLLNRSAGLDEAFVRAIQEIHRAGARAGKLTHQLLAFSRQQVLAPKIIDLNETVDEMSAFLERLVGDEIELDVHLGERVGRIRADSGQLQQVIMNLVVNARDAMPSGGTVVVQTAMRTIKAGRASQAGVGPIREAMPPGEYVMLTVSDTGTGMTPEVMRHLFEPFYTTKELGRGTGLGLSTVYGIVKQSGGFVTVQSELGKGSVFRILLPAVTGDSSEDSELPESTDMPRGSESVLVVEDDEFVRNLVKELLTSQGYTVYAAEKPADAVEMIAQHRGGLDLLLTDVVMPGMSGRDVASRAREICPDVKVLYMSGYTDDAILHHGVEASKLAFIAKPFSLHALASKVREVLDNHISAA